MAFAAVNPIAELWRGAGLKQILVPETFREAIKNAGRREPSIAQSLRSASPSPSRKLVPEKNTTQVNAQAERKRPAVWQPLPFESWPQTLQTQFKNTQKGQFAWTYRELGDDLAFARVGRKSGDDQKRKQRGKFLRELFQVLAFPAGTHCFWPVCEAGTENPEASEIYDLFWSAVQKLGCRGLIVLGSSAANIILPGMTLKPLSCVRAHGIPTVVLWDINGLAEKADVSGQVCEYLRTYLGQIGNLGQI